MKESISLQFTSGKDRQEEEERKENIDRKKKGRKKRGGRGGRGKKEEKAGWKERVILLKYCQDTSTPASHTYHIHTSMHPRIHNFTATLKEREIISFSCLKIPFRAKYNNSLHTDSNLMSTNE